MSSHDCAWSTREPSADAFAGTPRDYTMYNDYCRLHFASNMRIACQVLRQELPVGEALRKSHGPQYGSCGHFVYENSASMQGTQIAIANISVHLN